MTNDNRVGPDEILQRTYENSTESNRVNLIDENKNTVGVQNPLPTDGDSVYAKDIQLNESTIGDFSGDIETLFNDYTSTNVAASVGSGGVNPKSFKVRLKRPLAGTVIGVASPDTSISNAKLILKGLAGQTIKTIDFSSDNTKKGVQIFQFEQKYFTEVEIQFHTDDEVTVSGVGIFKAINVSIDAINGVISDDNSTVTNLPADTGGSDHIFTGEPIDTKNYGIVIVSLFSDVLSAIDGVIVEFANSPTSTWYEADTYSITSNEINKLKTWSVQTVLRWMRIRYINGTSPQTEFVLTTQLKPVYIKPSSHRVTDTISAQDDVELVKSVFSGKDQNNVFQNVRATEAGNLMTADFLVEVSRGNIPGYSFVRKFGYNPAVTTATADIYEWGQTSGAYNYTFSADGVADIDRLSSDASADTDVEITIEGLDINGDEVIQVISTDGTDGQTPVALTTSLWRVNRVYNSNTSVTIGNVYVFVDGATTGGVPNDVTAVRGYFSIANQQTLQAIYTVPNGKTGFFYGLKPSIVKKQAASVIITSALREFGKVKRTRDIFGLNTTGSSKTNDQFQIPLRFEGKTDFIPSADPDLTSGVSMSFLVLLIDN